MAGKFLIRQNRIFSRKGEVNIAPRCWRELCQHEVELIKTLLRAGQVESYPELRQRMTQIHAIERVRESPEIMTGKADKALRARQPALNAELPAKRRLLDQSPRGKQPGGFQESSRLCRRVRHGKACLNKRHMPAKGRGEVPRIDFFKSLACRLPAPGCIGKGSLGELRLPTWQRILGQQHPEQLRLAAAQDKSYRGARIDRLAPDPAV